MLLLTLGHSLSLRNDYIPVPELVHMLSTRSIVGQVKSPSLLPPGASLLH